MLAWPGTSSAIDPGQTHRACGCITAMECNRLPESAGQSDRECQPDLAALCSEPRPFPRVSAAHEDWLESGTALVATSSNFDSQSLIQAFYLDHQAVSDFRQLIELTRAACSFQA